MVRIGKKEVAEMASKKQALSTSRIAILDRLIESNLPDGRAVEVPAGMKII